ncbi:hypothetical protein CA54_14740 [Symmachiella macrocystis]|uniref:Uncharacterized protein n=1 Tax=Symmachiella macrocystis TaxID=2527985 RepID=A0A5C6BKR3_9PLAN|nr:hypothetical protein [Symmachiella macrocystis]TWU12650.1 hypothetical protein CA54_14740 [Symmachiella macrocystis]
MTRLFYLTLTLIVLVGLASASWLTLGATAGEENSRDLFSADVAEYQDQNAFDRTDTPHEAESRDLADLDLFVAGEQAKNPFAAEPTVAHDELLTEPSEDPQHGRETPAFAEPLPIRSDRFSDLDQPTRDALEEMANNIEREADELQEQGRRKDAQFHRRLHHGLRAIMERRKNRDGGAVRPPRVPFDINPSELDVDDSIRKGRGFLKIAQRDDGISTEDRELHRKIEHLQRAIENLKQADLEEQAQELHHQMHRMQRELQERHERRAMQERERRHRQERERREPAPRDDVHEALHDLRHEIRNLRNEVREMHELLEQHVKSGGKDEVELTPRNFEFKVEGEPRPFDERDIKKRDDQRNEIEEIAPQALDEEEVEEEVEKEHEGRPLSKPDNELLPINQPEQIKEAYGEAFEVLPSEKNKAEAN